MKFTDDYKRQIVQELDACNHKYEKSIIFNREGLNSRQVHMFRVQLNTTTPLRRRRTLEEKLEILAEYDACYEPGEKTKLAQREGLYQSTICEWRKQLKDMD